MTNGCAIEAFFDQQTGTVTYWVFDPTSRDALVIDPVLDYEPKSSQTSTESVARVARAIRERELRLRFILETHAHADHLSGAQSLKEEFPGAQAAIGERIRDVQRLFKGIFGLPGDFAVDGSQFDRLLHDGERLQAGTIAVEVIATPGHTPACCVYRIGDAAFTGDTLFMPDLGTGRCDFPGGSAEAMYDSIHERLYRLPEKTRVFVGHDYPPAGKRAAAWETTIGEQKRANKVLRQETPREQYVAARRARDAQLEAPALLFQSVQVNIDAGRLPAAEANRVRYLRIPINVFRPQPAAGPQADPPAIELREVPRA